MSTLQTIRRHWHQQLTDLRAVILSLPELLKNKALVMAWLKQSVAFCVALGFVLLASAWLLPMLMTFLSEWFYPPAGPSLGKSLAQIFGKNQTPALHEVRAQQWLVAAWLLIVPVLILVSLKHLARFSQQYQHGLSDQQDLVLDCDKTAVMPAISAEKTVKMATSSVKTIGQDQRYRIDRAIASGASGVVYQAFDTQLHRNVAIKELIQDIDAADAETLGRFKQEAQALAALNHPNIVGIFDIISSESNIWLVMELLAGGTLSERIKSTQGLGLGDAIEIILALAKGLSWAHQQGFVHRDIKPDNILFSVDDTPKIADFGIAKQQQSSVKTQQGFILGSPSYMSPEQAQGNVLDARSDIYSLGVSFYEMLTAQPPFSGDTQSVLLQHITQEVKPPSLIAKNIPESVDHIIIKMLEKDPDHRYQSAEQLVEALKAL